MKTATALPAPALSYKPRVKKLLIKGIIYLTSEKIAIFATVAAAILAWSGCFSDNTRLTGVGALMFLMGQVPAWMRQTARTIRRTL